MNKMKNKLFFITIVIAVVLNLRLVKSCNNNRKIEKEKQFLIEALSDTIKYYRDENQQNVARLQVIQYENAENFIKLASANDEIKRLQELVKKSGKNTSVATQIITKTVVDTTYHLEKIYSGWKHDLKQTFGNWITGELSFAPTDKTNEFGEIIYFSRVNLQVHDKLNIVHKKDADGRMFVEITNENPFSKIESLRSYYKTEDKPKILANNKPKRFSVGPNLSYGLNYKGEFLPYLGIGVQYNVIRF